MASCHSLVIVRGGGLAKLRTAYMITPATTQQATVALKTYQFWPGGVPARGPCGPNAIQYAVGWTGGVSQHDREE